MLRKQILIGVFVLLSRNIEKFSFEFKLVKKLKSLIFFYLRFELNLPYIIKSSRHYINMLNNN